MTEKKLQIKQNKKIYQSKKIKNFGIIFSPRVLSIPRNIDNIIENKWYKFQRHVSHTLYFIQTYVATNTENHDLPKTEFKVKSCSEALILNHIYIYIKPIYIYILCFYRDTCYTYTIFYIIQKY